MLLRNTVTSLMLLQRIILCDTGRMSRLYHQKWKPQSLENLIQREALLLLRIHPQRPSLSILRNR